MNDEQQLREVLGGQVARLREGAGKRQDDLAAAARSFGLAWPRTKIAALERGEKSISAEELLLLPALLTSALSREDDPVTFAELFDAAADVRLSSNVWAPARDLGAVLAGTRRSDEVLMRAAPTKATSAKAVRQMLENPLASRRVAELGLGRVRSSVLIAVEVGETEAEEKVARKLGEPRRVVSYVAAHLWKRSLSAERDARVAAALPADAPPRTVQAKRGQVTRELVRQIEDHIRQAEEKRTDGERRAKD